MKHIMIIATSLIHLEHSLVCALGIILCFVNGLQFCLSYKLDLTIFGLRYTNVHQYRQLLKYICIKLLNI